MDSDLGVTRDTHRCNIGGGKQCDEFGELVTLDVPEGQSRYTRHPTRVGLDGRDEKVLNIVTVPGHVRRSGGIANRHPPGNGFRAECNQPFTHLPDSSIPFTGMLCHQIQRAVAVGVVQPLDLG